MKRLSYVLIVAAIAATSGCATSSTVNRYYKSEFKGHRLSVELFQDGDVYMSAFNRVSPGRYRVRGNTLRVDWILNAVRSEIEITSDTLVIPPGVLPWRNPRLEIPRAPVDEERRLIDRYLNRGKKKE